MQNAYAGVAKTETPSSLQIKTVSLAFPHSTKKAAQNNKMDCV